MNIAERTKIIRDRIQNACQRSNRDINEITLLAVSKTYGSNHIEDALAAGLNQIGENYVQEAVEKFDKLKNKQLTWHFIGPLQSNKTRAIAERFDWVQTVDRLKIAQRLNDQRPEELLPLNICVQVNISQDPAKSGIMLSELPQVADQISTLNNLRLRGLMAIPAANLEQSQLRLQFKEMSRALAELKKHHPHCDTLSMGMTGDLETAIESGSTMVRVGSGIFGPREPK